MSKKDYIKFAAMLKETKKQATDAYSGYELVIAAEVISVIEEKMIVMFKADNPNFDIDRFLLATELE